MDESSWASLGLQLVLGQSGTESSLVGVQGVPQECRERAQETLGGSHGSTGHHGCLFGLCLYSRLSRFLQP